MLNFTLFLIFLAGHCGYTRGNDGHSEIFIASAHKISSAQVEPLQTLGLVPSAAKGFIHSARTGAMVTAVPI